MNSRVSFFGGGGADEADDEGGCSGWRWGWFGLVGGSARRHDGFAEHVGLALALAADGGAGVAAEEGHGFGVARRHGGGRAFDFIGLLARAVGFLGRVMVLGRR